MRIRVRFEKKGPMKFIGHLDVMRYFQKAIRRAGLDVAYSEGYNPHMIMSFASPLGIGLTSDAEYFDIELLSPVSSDDAISVLNRSGAEGLKVTGFVQVPEDKASKAMTLVSAADYKVTFRKGYEPEPGWEDKLRAFLSQDQIPVIKKTKRSEKEVDIKPMIFDWSVKNGVVFFQLAAGSSENLKPELIMNTFMGQINMEAFSYSYEINRCEIYTDLGTQGQRKLVSLYSLGDPI